MSTKPTDVVRWGETAGGSATSNLTVPSSGHQDTGWALSEAPTSGLFNWLGQRSYKWFQWLNDGDCAFHNLSATGTFGATGNTTLSGTLGVTGTSTLSSLHVTGTSTLDGNVTAGGTLGVTGLITATAGLTAAANQHVTVSGTGRHKHGDMILHVSTVSGDGTGWGFDSANGYLLASGAGTWTVGIPSVVGWRLKSLTFELWGDGVADLSGGVFLRHKNSAGAQLTPISATNPAAAWNDQAIDFTDTTIVDGDSFWVNFTANAANLRVGEIRVTFDFP